jgi:aspartyl-tRNA(Asn)/glutamyl-tRNA(Gln) amidotransferase subunit C
MAAIDRDEVVRIAKLAHLHLDEQEIDRMAGELTAILGYVGQLSELDLEGVVPTAHGELGAVELRADVPGDSLEREAVLAEAPKTAAGAFAVAAFVEAE